MNKQGSFLRLLGPNQPKAQRAAYALIAIVVSACVLDPDAGAWLAEVTPLACAPWVGRYDIQPWIKGRSEVAARWARESLGLLEESCKVLDWRPARAAALSTDSADHVVLLRDPTAKSPSVKEAFSNYWRAVDVATVAEGKNRRVDSASGAKHLSRCAITLHDALTRAIRRVMDDEMLLLLQRGVRAIRATAESRDNQNVIDSGRKFQCFPNDIITHDKLELLESVARALKLDVRPLTAPQANAPNSHLDEPGWSAYMPKSQLADIVNCDPRELVMLYESIVESKSRQRWRLRLDKCEAPTVKRYEMWLAKPRQKKRPRGKTANSRKLSQVQSDSNI